jgi:hypothetical protein
VLLCGCGGSSGGPGGDANAPTDTVITGLTVSAVGAHSATLSFSTSQAVGADVSVWLDTDDATVPPLMMLTSPSAASHSVELDSLWSTSPWRVEVTAGNAVASTTFTTADPSWPAVCRSGALVLPVDGAGSWSTYTDDNGSIEIEASPGCEGAGGGARFTFDLGDGEWVVAASNDGFVAPLDLSAYSHLWVPMRGTPGVPVAFEIKLRDSSGALSVARIDGGTGVPVWRSWAVDKREFLPQFGTLDFSDITALEFAFSWPSAWGGPRSGTVEVGHPSVWSLAAEQPQVTGFERIPRNEAAMAAIAADLLSRQRPHGFLPAWFELAPNWHLYANAMALIVFALEYERTAGVAGSSSDDYLNAAYLAADRLVELQQLSARNGAWDDSFREVNGTLELYPSGSRQVWVGSTAWAGIALIIARDLLPDGGRYEAAIAAAAQFYADEQSVAAPRQDCPPAPSRKAPKAISAATCSWRLPRNAGCLKRQSLATWPASSRGTCSIRNSAGFSAGPGWTSAPGSIAPVVRSAAAAPLWAATHAAAWISRPTGAWNGCCARIGPRMRCRAWPTAASSSLPAVSATPA